MIIPNQLRTHPLCFVPDEVIRHRAYLRSLASPSASMLANWFAAEHEEIATRMKMLFVELTPLGESAFPFTTAYETVFSWNDHHPVGIVLGESSPRKCSLCLRTRAEGATFRMEAHVVPQLLGSSAVVTHDECDECNQQAGRLYESDLGNLLLPGRAVGGGRGQKGPVAAKFERDGTFVRHRNGRLVVGVREGGKHVNVHLDKNELQLDITRTTYRPRRVALALAKAAWQALPPERREEFDTLRQYVRGTMSWTATRLYRVPMPGLRRASFAVWCRRPEAPSTLPPLVVFVSTTNTILVWNCPDLTSGEHQRPVFPPLLRWFDRSPPTIVEVRTQGDEAVPARPESYRFGFAWRQLAMVNGPTPVRIEFDDGDGAVSVATRLTTPLADQTEQTDEIVYNLEGDDLIGRVIIECRPAERSVTVRFSLDVAPRADMPLEPTLRLLAAIAAGRPLRIVDESGDEVLPPLGGKPATDMNLLILEDGVRTAERLAVLRDRLGVSITFPQSMDDEQRRFLGILAEGVRRGAVRENTPNARSEVEVPASMVMQWTSDQMPDELRAVHLTDWQVNAQRIDPGPVLLAMEGVVFDEPLDDMKSRARAAEGDEPVRVAIRYRSLRHEFANFLPPEPAPLPRLGRRPTGEVGHPAMKEASCSTLVEGRGGLCVQQWLTEAQPITGQR